MSANTCNPTSDDNRGSCRRCSDVVDTLAQGLIFQDSAGVIVGVNPAAERILGRTAEEMLGRTPDERDWTAIHPDGSPFPGSEHPCMVALRSGEAVRDVRMGVVHPGERQHRWLLVSAHPLFNPGESKPCQVYSSFQDVTELVRTQQALHEGEETHRNIIESLPMGMHTYRLEPDGQLTFIGANPAADGILGVGNAQFVGQTIEDAFPALAQTQIPDRYRDVCRTGIPWCVEEVLYDDERISGAYQVHAFRTGDRTMAALFLDITDRKRAELALRQSEELYRTLVETSPDGITMADLDGRVKRANKRIIEMLGHAEEGEVVGTSAFDFIVAEQHEQAAEGLRSALQRGGFGPAEYRLRREDGSTFHGQLTVARLHDAKGVPSGFMVITRDITADKEAAEERASLEERLVQSQKMEAIGRLAGGVAHDFNNLLTGIGGYAEILLSKIGPGDVLQVDLLEIQRAVERASSLTSQLLAFSRKQVISPKVMQVNDVVGNAQKMLGRIIGEDIEFEFRAGADLWFVRADPSQVDQILFNLVTNSRDAMPSGGRLTIETENAVIDAEVAQTYAELEPGDYVSLSVSDSGLGMDAQTQQRVFEPFFSTKEVGTGLGLSTVYGAVCQNNGAIKVSSEPGEGTIITILFPRVDQQPAEVTAPEDREGPRGWETVLVVEDEPMVRALARQFLEDQGYRVLVAEDCDDAERLCRQEEGAIHLLLTDVVMPQMNGRELYTCLVARRPQLRVLYMSGYTEDVIIRRGVLEDGTPFMRKPFTARDLVEKVRVALDT